MSSWKVPAFAVALVIGFAVGLALGKGMERTGRTRGDGAPGKILLGAESGAEDKGEPMRPDPQIPQSGIEPPPGQASPAVSAMRRLLAVFHPAAVEQALHVSFVLSFREHPEAQEKLFDLLMTAEDPELVQAGRIYLHSIRDSELLRRIVHSFEEDSNTARRDFLAYLLGANCGEALITPTVEKVLASGDPGLLASILGHLDFGTSESAKDSQDRLFPKIRDLAAAGPSSEVRGGAVCALYSDRTDEGTRLLAHLLMNDSDPIVRRHALSSLSISRLSEPPLMKEQLSALWFVARNESSDLPLRRAVADQLVSLPGEATLTDEERAFLKSLSETKD